MTAAWQDLPRWAALGAALLLAPVCPAADLYVSPAGSDSNAGTRARPFATLERARDEARRLRQNHKPSKGALTIWLRAGDYFRTNALDLTAEDSGTPNTPVCWSAIKGETVRLLGGRPLSGFVPVTDPATLGRLPEPGREHIVQVNLRTLGITDFGQMQSRGFARPLTAAHCELFFGGRPMTLARWPNEGEWERIAGWPEAGAAKNEWGKDVGKLEDGFLYNGDRPRGWRDISELWVHGYWSWDWANSYERVASIDVDRRHIKTAAPYGLYSFRKKQRFYFLNVMEELDQPGEWFLDRNAGLLYFWPPDPGVRQSSGAPEILLSLLAKPLLVLTNASHVTFRGLIFEANRGNAVEIRGGTSNLIAGCLIRNIGDYGVTITGGTGHGVSGCDIFDTGDGGVSMDGGDRQTLRPGGHYVENCHFARQGRWSKCYVPAVLIGGVGLRASHNLIHDHPHCAILFNGNDHLLEFNEIYRYALETGDVGAIYTGRDYTYRGNRIRHNFLHAPGGVGMGSMGVYMDDNVSGTEILGNVFYQVKRAVFLGGGRDHQVLNNIFVDCDYAVELDGRGLNPNPVWHNMVNNTMRLRLTEVPLSLYRDRYPALKALDQYYGPPGGPPITGADFKGVPPEGNVVGHNVCVGRWLHAYWLATADMIRLDNNLTNAVTAFRRPPGDPPRAQDFALLRSSPAWELGFKPIPFGEIGLRRDKLRSSLPGARASH
ncbi:MAG TPA: right-handed parallel beta-helix repeat-containing protein [Candidatus Paceibacterota bacterium]|nr:right-handed parallel beta-helix repeat-containing protein [Verrucomicrobiota bacterium]HSA12664.1 right-handed parallel beta-helix repeat-containing protein [Candidatus Paceibacterota bacterium]